MNSILEELEWRGLLKQVTNEEKVNYAQKMGKAVYCGFDPTADSLHVGHLIQIMLLERFRRFNFKPIAVVGGGTGMIGDPSGKTAERQLLTKDIIDKNVVALSQQFSRLIPNIKTVDNGQWLAKMDLLTFLRDVGKSFNISYLLAKENIATRIESGLSFTEFTYTLLQAYDFYHLYVNNDCVVQLGGSDQWGNIVSGTDFIRKTLNQENDSCGITINLLLKEDGTKFGKTESKAVWLDENKTSPYEFYQFFYNQDDKQTIKLLKFLTFLTSEEIKIIEQQQKKQAFERKAQEILAQQLTLFVHGEKGLQQAQLVTDALFKGNINNLSFEQLQIALSNVDTYVLEKDDSLVNVLVDAKIALSRREVREFLAQRAISVNCEVISDENFVINKSSAINQQITVIKKGKRKYFAIKHL